jgi:carbon storage regulator
MLVIRRRPGESLVIGDGVEIEILDATASQVKLGIRAPREVSVLRKEIQIAAEQNRASAGDLSAEVGQALARQLRRLTSSTLPHAPSSEPAPAPHPDHPSPPEP